MNQRVQSVDVLRGVAALMILVENIMVFALPAGFHLPEGSLISMVFDMKGMALFSMLFGASVVLMDAGGGLRASAYYRRLLVLFAIGVVHAYVFWFGDILVAYSLCGLLLFPLRRVNAWALVVLGAVVCSVPALASILHVAAPVHVAAVDPAIVANAGTWGDVAALNARRAVMMQTYTFGAWTFWRALGLMLVGMGVMRLGVFSASLPRGVYTWLAVCGIGSGVPLYGLNPYVGSVPVAVGLAAVVMLWCSSGFACGLRRRLAAVGRMALTTYLSQTVLMTLVFSGYGLALFGHVGVPQLWAIVGVVWCVQLLASPAWLRAFGIGPAERLWRMLDGRTRTAVIPSPHRGTLAHCSAGPRGGLP